MQFQVRKNNFEEHRLVDHSLNLDAPSLAEGEIVVRLDAFAYTANNITYAVLGDRMGYWQFFPAAEDSETWGVIPVWGFADVVASASQEIPVGDRLFGYFPPATHLKLVPSHVSPRRFVDSSEHRRTLPAGYNLYQRVLAESNYSQAMDRERMLLFPLHLTSYCLWDLLQDKNWYEATQIVILSASSKTSIGLAHAIAADQQSPKLIGISSTPNLPALQPLGLYETILAYEDLTKIDAKQSTVIVDMSGNGAVLTQLNQHLGSQRAFTIRVGLTHWQKGATFADSSMERSEVFFAPSHIQRRLKEWGPAKYQKKTTDFMLGAAQQLKAWLSFRELDGLEGLQKLHTAVCKGKVPPNEGLIVKL
ncbi:MAG: DUF2855 family protein [Saprospiraceae bacterium]